MYRKGQCGYCTADQRDELPPPHCPSRPMALYRLKLAQSKADADVAVGSISEVGARSGHVRFPPVSDQTADIAGCPKRANSGLTDLEFASHILQKRCDFTRRPKVSDTFRRRRVDDELPVPRRQISIAARDDPVA